MCELMISVSRTDYLPSQVRERSWEWSWTADLERFNSLRRKKSPQESATDPVPMFDEVPTRKQFLSFMRKHERVEKVGTQECVINVKFRAESKLKLIDNLLAGAQIFTYSLNQAHRCFLNPKKKTTSHRKSLHLLNVHLLVNDVQIFMY